MGKLKIAWSKARRIVILFMLLIGPIVARGAEWAVDPIGKLRPIQLFPIILFKCTTTSDKLAYVSYYKGKYKYWFGKNNRSELTFSSTPFNILLRQQGEYWRKSGFNSKYYDPFPLFNGAYIYDIRTEPLIEYGPYRGTETSIYIFKNNKDDDWYEEIGSIRCKEETVIINWITDEIPPSYKLFGNQLFDEGLFNDAKKYFE